MVYSSSVSGGVTVLSMSSMGVILKSAFGMDRLTLLVLDLLQRRHPHSSQLFLIVTSLRPTAYVHVRVA